MCCHQARWKREQVLDHKFDFINVREFHSTSLTTRLRYLWIYILLLKSFAVYGLDIFTAITMLTTNHWTSAVHSKCGDDCVIKIPFDVAKWIFVGCIIFSFLLLGYETWKAKKVIDSRDISYAYTNVLANDYYSLKSYDNFCFFCQINNSRKKKDEFAFFIFFTFKDWKRLLLADGPRQSINALTLYSFAAANNFQTKDLPAYWDGSITTLLLLLSMMATVAIFAGSMILLIAAAIFYVPLLCYIQGNLKEYCCHKIDKRISELMRKKQRQRVARNLALEKKLLQGEQVTNKKGEVITTGPQPTLPAVNFDDYDEDMQMRTKRGGARGPVRSKSGRSLDEQANPGGAGWGPEKYYVPDVQAGQGYPQMPPNMVSYNSFDNYSAYPPGPARSNDGHGGDAYGYGSSENAYSSTTNLTAAMAPPGVASYALEPIPGSYASSHLSNPHSPMYDPNRPSSPVARVPTSRSDQSINQPRRPRSKQSQESLAGPYMDYLSHTQSSLPYDSPDVMDDRYKGQGVGQGYQEPGGNGKPKLIRPPSVGDYKPRPPVSYR